MNLSYAVFDTAVGACGIAWGEAGILGVQLPEGDRKATQARLGARFPEAKLRRPSPPIAEAIRAIKALLDGAPSELGALPLDLGGQSDFYQQVYQAARQIPPGQTLSYGELAKQLGSPGASRAVGQALGRNPFPIIVPCHRVLGAGGKLGGFSAHGGLETKVRLLQLERERGAGALPLFAPKPAGADHSKALRHLKKADPTLAQLIEEVGPCGLKVNQTTSLFAALAESIVYQQLHGKAAATIFGRVQALFPKTKQGLTAAQIFGADEAALRGAGLSRSKLLAMKDLAARTLQGELPTLEEAQTMDEEAIIERLIVVRGIGRWTVEMLLMFRLGRPDVLPVADYGIKKGFMVAYRKRAMPEPKLLLKRGELWRPYRSIASWYLWRAAERSKA